MGREAASVLAAESLSFLCILLVVWPEDFSFLYPKVWAHQSLSPSPLLNPSHMAPPAPECALNLTLNSSLTLILAVGPIPEPHSHPEISSISEP